MEEFWSERKNLKPLSRKRLTADKLEVLRG
jgi:hypothetical protein